MSGEALLPCPFCGGEGDARRDFDPRYPWYVKYEHLDHCPLFFVSTANPQSYRSKEAAIAAWNIRTHPASNARQDEGTVV